MTELVNMIRIDDNEQDQDLLESQRDLLKSNQNDLKINRLTCIAIVSNILVFIFLLFWLAESQFSHGILRPRYYQEYCGPGFLNRNLTCAKGFECNFNQCKVRKDLRENITPYGPDYNGTLDFCPECQDCPICPSIGPTIYKKVSYFDFNEHPGYWIDPGAHGYFSRNTHISYGACKEICVKNIKCQMINYQTTFQYCWLAQSYEIGKNPVRNLSYTGAIKTGLPII